MISCDKTFVLYVKIFSVQIIYKSSSFLLASKINTRVQINTLVFNSPLNLYTEPVRQLIKSYTKSDKTAPKVPLLGKNKNIQLHIVIQK